MKKHIQKKDARTTRGYPGRTAPLKTDQQTVLVVDDESALSAIARLIRSAGFKVRAFSHPSALLSEQLPTRNACLIIDIYLPEMNGVELTHTLAASGRALPTIFVSGRNDELTRRLVENSTAVAVLFKPVDEVPLLSAISRCLNLSGAGPVLGVVTN